LQQYSNIAGVEFEIDNAKVSFILGNMFILLSSYFAMSTVRKTISLPPALAKQLDQQAKQRKTSVSALVVELMSQQAQTLPYAGLIDDDEDLSLQVEDLLARRLQ
jgi:hypothetical protein